MALALHECCDSHCPEWAIYLVEAVTDFVVWRESPTGEVSGETAGWLLEWLTEAGAVRVSAGLEILLHVLEVARAVPAFLSAATLNQLRLAMLPEPRGAYADRRAKGRGVSRDDLAFVWRVLRSGIDRGAGDLSRAERRILNEIHLLADPKDHHQGWRELITLAMNEPETREIRIDEPRTQQRSLSAKSHAA
ncbi:MAG: hypothetical protein ACK4N1_01970 [Pseudorhizobium sp.]